MQWSQVPWRPSRKMLREFAMLWVAFFALIGWWNGWSAPILGSAAFWTILLGIGALGIVHPPLVRPIFVGWMVLAFPIGWCVLHLALAFVYFAVLTPIALVFRIMGRDLLQLRPAPERTTFWLPKVMPADTSRYLRTF